MDPNKTCGDLHLDGMQKYATGNYSVREVWAAGFVSGQAEKIALGVCRAMFRVSPELYVWFSDILTDVCKRYGLSWLRESGEYWMYSGGPNEKAAILRVLYSPMKNSHEWHTVRGKLCGIPDGQIDVLYHERKNFNAPCDRIEGEVSR